MNTKTVLRLSDLHGLAQLGGDATLGVTDLVEAMHAAIARPHRALTASAPQRTSGIAGLVYRSIRGVTRAAATGLQVLPSTVRHTDPGTPSSSQRDAMLSALNGVLGDHLAATGNALTLPMRLHHDGKPVMSAEAAATIDIPDPSQKLLILVHGLCMNASQWTRKGHNHGAALANALGYTPLYLNYNSGLPISRNGQHFANLIEALLERWPTAVDDITIIGHSMGGLLARSACQHGANSEHVWLGKLRNLVCMGSPHQGAPLERRGHWIDLVLGATPFAAPIARIGGIRSAGITDLRHGHLFDGIHDVHTPSTTKRRRPSALPSGVRCHAIAATVGKRHGDLHDRLLGDGLVPVASALGHHPDPARAVRFAKSRQWIGYNMNHLDLLSHPQVAERLLHWLSPRPTPNA